MGGALAVPSSLRNQGLISRPDTLAFMFRLFNALPLLGSSFFEMLCFNVNVFNVFCSPNQTPRSQSQQTQDQWVRVTGV